MRLRHWNPAMAREAAIVQIAGTPWRSGWSQAGMYGFRPIIRIQKTGIAVAIVHLIQSHVWRFLIRVRRNWSVSISVSWVAERRAYPRSIPRSASWAARRLQIRLD